MTNIKTSAWHKLSAWIYLSVCMIFMMASCDLVKGKRRHRGTHEDDSSVRRGRELSLEDLKFYDAQPRLNAAGNKLVFMSGRQSVMRVFKVDLTTSSLTSSRVTTDTDALPSEIEAVLSPQGDWVLMTVNTAEGVDIYARKFDGSGDLVRITNDSEPETSLTVHPTLGAYAFVKRNLETGSNQIFVGSLSETTGPTKTPSVVSSNASVSEDSPTFLPDDGSGKLRLAYLVRSSTDATYSIGLKDLSSTANPVITSDVSVTTQVETGLARQFPFVATSADFYFIGQSATEDTVKVDAVGNFNYPSQFIVQSVVASYRLAKKAVELLPIKGMAVRSLVMSGSANPLLAWISRQPYSCEEGKIAYSTKMNIYNSSSKKIIAEPIPRLINDDKQSMRAADDLCATSVDVEGGLKIDDQVTAVQLNSDASLDNFTAAYVSWVTGDNEVYYLRKQGGVYTVKAVSQNHK